MPASVETVSDPRPLTPAEEELLRKRAARYARRGEASAGRPLEVVELLRGGVRFAVLLTHLLEVRALRRLCRIPGASPAVPGVFYHRGEVLSAHDLAQLLGGRGDAEPTASWVLVAERAGERIGLLADEVFGVETVRETDVHPVPMTLGGGAAGLRGLLPSGAVLLDVPALFDTASFFCAF